MMLSIVELGMHLLANNLTLDTALKLQFSYQEVI